MATVPLLVAMVSHLVVTVPPLVAAVSPLVITLSFCSMTSALGGYGLVVPDEKKRKPSLVACVGQEHPIILRVWKQGIKVEANLDEKASLSLANEVTKI